VESKYANSLDLLWSIQRLPAKAFISRMDRTVLSYIATYSKAEPKYGGWISYPSLSTIGAALDLHERSLRRHIANLEKRGHLKAARPFHAIAFLIKVKGPYGWKKKPYPEEITGGTPDGSDKIVRLLGQNRPT
jgi:hypothetical protein